MNHATAAMCIDDPLQHHEAWYHRLYDTHPPIEERIAALEKIASRPVGLTDRGIAVQPAGGGPSEPVAGGGPRRRWRAGSGRAGPAAAPEPGKLTWGTSRSAASAAKNATP